jgi:hypothetical protein
VRSPLPLNTLAGTTNFSVSFTFQVAAAAPTRDRLALTTILRRKGRVLDAVAASMQTLLGPQAITAGAAITAVFYLPASPLASGWWTTAALKN